MTTQTDLSRLGFPTQTVKLDTCIREFQASWSLGPLLTVDGIVGPYTVNAIKISLERLRAGKGTMSQYFSFAEAACKCRGSKSGCKGLVAPRQFVHVLDRVRAVYGHPISPYSWYRCPGRNTQVGGGRSSMHLKGLAVDWRFNKSVEQVTAWKLVSGIEWVKGQGVTHIDCRHFANKTGTVAHPCVFEWTGRLQ